MTEFRVKFEGPARFLGMIGYFDLVMSIQRQWRGDYRGSPTWRHVTIGLRSPVCYYGFTSIPRPAWRWFPLRFGYGDGNLYLGILYIVTTFGRGYHLRYKSFGPLQWAWEANEPR